jgi:hypothetical protein
MNSPSFLIATSVVAAALQALKLKFLVFLSTSGELILISF